MQMLFLVLLVALGDVEVFKPTGIYAKQPEVSADPDDFYVVMFTAPYCGPCKTWKQGEDPQQLKAAGLRLTYVDISVDQRFYSGPIPRLWLCKNQQRVYEFPAGGVKAAEIVKQVDSLRKIDAEVKTILSEN